jgi:hypothetical protein
VQSSTTSCHFIPIRFNYSPKHPVLKHTQPVFFPQRERQISTPVQTNMQNCGCIYFNLHISREQTGRQKILNFMLASIPRIILLLISS